VLAIRINDEYNTKYLAGHWSLSGVVNCTRHSSLSQLPVPFVLLRNYSGWKRQQKRPNNTFWPSFIIITLSKTELKIARRISYLPFRDAIRIYFCLKIINDLIVVFPFPFSGHFGNDRVIVIIIFPATCFGPMKNYLFKRWRMILRHDCK